MTMREEIARIIEENDDEPLAWEVLAKFFQEVRLRQADAILALSPLGEPTEGQTACRDLLALLIVEDAEHPANVKVREQTIPARIYDAALRASVAGWQALTRDERSTVEHFRPSDSNHICLCVANTVCVNHALIAIIDRLAPAEAKS